MSRKLAKALALHSTGFTISYDQYKPWMDSWAGKLKAYEILNSQEESDRHQKVKATIENNGESFTFEEVVFEVVMENNIWRVKAPTDFMDLVTNPLEVEEETVEEDIEEPGN